MNRPSKRSAARGGVVGALWLAWPSTLSMLLFTLVQLWGLRVVQPLGAEAVAALTTGGRITFLAQALLNALSVGCVAMVARAWGARAFREATRVTLTASQLTVLVGVAMGALCWLTADLIPRPFLAAEEVLARQMAADYLRGVAWWIPAFGLNLMFSQALRAAGSVLLPLAAAAVMTAVNIPLLLWMVEGSHGMPQLGVTGVAVSGGVAMALGAALMAGLWLLGRTPLPRTLRPPLLHLRTRRLIRLGIPAAGEQFALQMGLLLFTFTVGLYGLAAYSAYGVGVQILSVSFLFGVGFSMAASTLVGQAVGAGDFAAARREGWQATGLAVGVMTLLGGLLVLFRHQLAGFFAPDPEVARHTAVFVLMLGSMQPLMGLEFAISGALRGAGDTRTPFLITLTGFVFVRQTLGLAALWAGLDVAWVYAALIGDYVAKAALYLWRFHSGSWLPKYGRKW